MTGVVIINPGSGPVGAAGQGWTNTVEGARAVAADWLDNMRRAGIADVELLPGEEDLGNGRWLFRFRHAVTGVEAALDTHGLSNISAYEREAVFPPRVYWRGSSSANPDVGDFAAPGYKLTYVREGR